MWKAVVSLLVVFGAMVAGACAQRPQDFTRIPEPISVEELRRYGDILGLSDDQRFAAEAAYDQYLDEFDPLRREMIEAAVNQPASTRDAEQFTGVLPGFLARTEALDEALYGRLDPILIEAQREHLPRVRDLRARTVRCNIDALGRFIGDSLPELRELLEELSPPPEVLEPLGPALAEYERKATIGVREIYEATMRLCGSPQPEDAAKDKLIDGVKSLRAMNRKLVDDLTPSLPADIARKWRGEFLARAYGHAADVAQIHAIARLDAALASNIAEAERATIQGLRDQALEFEASVLKRMLDLGDQYAIVRAGPGGAVADPTTRPSTPRRKRSWRARAT